MQKRLPKNARRHAYGLRPDDGELLLERSSPLSQVLRAAFKDGRMKFECVESRENFWVVML